MSIKIAASILSCDFSRLADEIKKCNDAGIDILHIDVMDGHFVPNITIGPIIVEAIRPLTKLPIDAHLMIENPSMCIDKFIDAGSDIITLHAECYGLSRGLGKFPKEVDKIDVSKAIKDILAIKNRGKKVGLTLNPGTPLCIEEVLEELDKVLIMSVNPGFAGQKFMPEVLPKIRRLRQIFNRDIEVDGGINEETALLAVQAGANILATASCFFSSQEPDGLVRRLKSIR
jgi:ribulose-phosphate 3-epimerase